MTQAGLLTNLAQKTAQDQADPNPANDQASVGVTGQAVADLVVTLDPVVTNVVPGTVVTYTLTVTNNGPSRATGVVLTDTLPAGVTLAPSTPEGPTCTVTGATVTCLLGSLEPGASAVVPLTGTVTIAGVLTNTASVSAHEIDPNPGNNTVIVSTTSNTPPVATNDLVTIIVNTPVAIHVLGNDSDADGDPLTVTGVTAPAHGTVVRHSDGTVTYTPQAEFVGPDTFTYTISDERGGTATALVTVMMTAAEVEIVTPQEDEVIAGDAVAVAAFNLPTQPTVRSVRAVTTIRIPTDTVAVRFQFLPEGTSVWHDIGEAVTPPFFRVSWDTTRRPDGAYLVRAIASRATGPPEASQPVRVRIDNNATAGPPDIVETPAFRMQRLLALQENIVVTSAGVVVALPAGTLPADDELTIDMPAVAQAPGTLPGEVAAPLVRLVLTSGQRTLLAPFTVFFPYADTNHDGLVDGTSIDETTLSLWFFDESSRTWICLAHAVLHPDFNAIEVTVNRPALFGILHVASASPACLAPLTVGFGEHSPHATATVHVSAQTGARPVLHVRLDTGAERVSITEATVAFAAPLGNHQAPERLQVQVIHDADGNGQIDAGEPILATATVHSVLDPITLTFPAPLDLHPHATTYVVVVLRIDGNGAETRGGAPRRTGWFLLSPVLFALALFPWRRRLAPWMGLGLVLVMCGLGLTSCEGGHAELTGNGCWVAKASRKRRTTAQILRKSVNQHHASLEFAAAVHA